MAGFVLNVWGDGKVWGTVVRSFKLLPKADRRKFISLAAARILANGLDILGLAGVGLLGAMIAGGISGQTTFIIFDYPLELTSSSIYLTLTGVIASTFIAKSAVSAILLRVTTAYLARLEASLAVEVAEYLFSGDLARLKSLSRGRMQWALVTSTNVSFYILLSAAATLVAEVTLLVGIMVGFVLFSPPAAAGVFLYFGLVLVVYQLSISGRLKRLGIRLSENGTSMNNSVLDSLSTFKEALVLGRNRSAYLEFQALRHAWARDLGLQRFVMGLPRYLVETALLVGVFGLVLGAYVSGSLLDSLATIAVFLAGGTRMMAAVLPLQASITDLRIQTPQAQVAQDLLSAARASRAVEEPLLVEATPRVRTRHRGAAVSVKNLSFSYPLAEAPALDGLSFDIEPGKFVAIIGPSGSGKTTLSDLVLGVSVPEKGTVQIGGLEPRAVIRKHPGDLAIVTQYPGLVAGTFAENIALGIPASSVDESRILQVASDVGLTPFLSSLPKGVYSDVGIHADSLSGGQRQRIGLARALYSRPRLLVLDEATSALDPESESAITQLVDKLRGSVTVLVIAHRMSTIQDSDYVLALMEGRLVGVGSLHDLKGRVPFVERYLKISTSQMRENRRKQA